MDLGKYLKAGWFLFLKDILVLVIGAFIVMMLTGFTVGILGGPLIAGYYRAILRRSRENRPAEFGDIFSCFGRFGSYLVAFYLMIIGAIPLLYFATLWIYMFPLMIEKELPLGEAIRQSTEIVKKNNLGMHWGFIIILTIINIVGHKLTTVGFFSIGSLLTYPFTFCCIIGAYTGINPLEEPVQKIVKEPEPEKGENP